MASSSNLEEGERQEEGGLQSPILTSTEDARAKEVPVKAEDFPARIGARVKRGADWVWDEQDGASGLKGRILHDGTRGSQRPWTWVRVKWDCGTENSYRSGADGKYDLVYVTKAQEISVGSASSGDRSCPRCKITWWMVISALSLLVIGIAVYTFKNPYRVPQGDSNELLVCGALIGLGFLLLGAGATLRWYTVKRLEGVISMAVGVCLLLPTVPTVMDVWTWEKRHRP